MFYALTFAFQNNSCRPGGVACALLDINSGDERTGAGHNVGDRRTAGTAEYPPCINCLSPAASQFPCDHCSERGLWRNGIHLNVARRILAFIIALDYPLLGSLVRCPHMVPHQARASPRNTQAWCRLSRTQTM